MTDSYSSDRFALQDLLLSYAAAVDERDQARYTSCFDNDVEIINFGEGNFRGRDAWVNYVWSALDKYSATQHLLGMQWAEINGDIANTRTDFQATHILIEDAQRFILWGTYISSMQRSEAGWQITRHELAVRASALN
jgi:3-phenylpropionate/cinnamic acid dioxygenase small subunit